MHTHDAYTHTDARVNPFTHATGTAFVCLHACTLMCMHSTQTTHVQAQTQATRVHDSIHAFTCKACTKKRGLSHVMSFALIRAPKTWKKCQQSYQTARKKASNARKKMFVHMKSENEYVHGMCKAV